MSRTQNRGQSVQESDIEVGCILFLPSESYTVELKCMWSDITQHPCHNHGHCVLKSEGHNHPVVVIGKHYGFDQNNPSRLTLSFVQMTHGSPKTPSDSGASVYSPYGHYNNSGATGLPTFPKNLRSRYWFRGLEYLQDGPGNFRIPHVFYAPFDKFKTMNTGPEAKASDARLDEGSYLRLMQRLNLEPKEYQRDDGNDRSSSPPSNGGTTHGNPSSEPRGHRIENRDRIRVQ